MRACSPIALFACLLSASRLFCIEPFSRLRASLTPVLLPRARYGFLEQTPFESTIVEKRRAANRRRPAPRQHHPQPREMLERTRVREEGKIRDRIGDRVLVCARRQVAGERRQMYLEDVREAFEAIDTDMYAPRRASLA